MILNPRTSWLHATFSEQWWVVKKLTPTPFMTPKSRNFGFFRCFQVPSLWGLPGCVVQLMQYAFFT